MPSTTPERHARIAKWFERGSESNGNAYLLDCECLKTLCSMGFYERAGVIHGPTPSHSPTYEQWEMVMFLCEEWDYGFHFEARR